MNTINIQRGQSVRLALLAIVRDCQRRGLPLPTYAALSLVTGTDESQVSRHLARLMDEGAFSTRGCGRRIQIQEMRS